MKNSLAIALLLSGMTTYTHAQVLRNTAERVGNQQEINLGRQQLERDIREIADFKLHTTAFEKALSAADMSAAQRQLALVTADMQREIRQSETKMNADQREMNRSAGEVASERRELARGRRDIRRTGNDRGDDIRDQVRDRANKADDKRDLRDDRADRNEQAARLQRQRQILQFFMALQFSDQSHFTKARANVHLLAEFAQTMEADLAETREELGEDKTEKREDRRESRDDRRERREKGKSWK